MSKQTVFVTLCVCATATAIAAMFAGAGPLTPPPGPVASTPEIEARIPIGPDTTPGDADSLFRITQPGSYYLTDNINGAAGMHGIKITASGVTLDLNGFALLGAAGSLDGVTSIGFPTANLVRLHNGSVRDWGGDGVDLNNGADASVHDVIAADNSGYGVWVGSNSVVRRCTAESNGIDGIRASTVCVVADSVARANVGNGILADTNSIVRGCIAASNGADGIHARAACTVEGNNAGLNTGDGIEVLTRSTVRSNLSRRNGEGGDGAGIHVTGQLNRIDENNLMENDRGLDVDASLNLIVRNSSYFNGANYVLVANNRVGPIVIPPFSPAINGGTGGLGVGSTDPWANISY